MTVEITMWTVTSGYGGNTRQPFVEVIIRPHEFMTQMSPSQAREIAMNLLTAADAAEGDAFLIEFVHQKIGAPMEKAAQILVEFRKWRETRNDAT